MHFIDCLLAATDFSVAGNQAVRRAALLAHEHGARLHILHVVDHAGRKPLRDGFLPTRDLDLQAAQARDVLRGFAVEIAGTWDVSASIEVAVGDPFKTLLKASEHAGLVVLGRHGRRGLRGLLVGGMVERMLRLCPHPVLAVRNPVHGPYRKVLAPIDCTALSDAAVRVADRMRHGQRLHVFHAIRSQRQAVLRNLDVPEHVIAEARRREEAETSARMQRALSRLGLAGTPLGFGMAFGPPARSSLRHAQDLGADLIVVGTRARSRLGQLLFGSVSGRLLAEASCDLLVVPGRRDGAPPQPAKAVAPTALPQHPVDGASLVRGAAAQAGRLTPVGWIHNEARFVSRKPS